MAIPIYELEFSKAGLLPDASQERRIVSSLSPSVRNVIVFAHGWNTSPADAQDFYKRFLGYLRTEQTVAIGIIWPSTEFGAAALVQKTTNLSRDEQDELVKAVGAMVDRETDPSQAAPEEGNVTIRQRSAPKGGGAGLLRSFSLPLPLRHELDRAGTAISRLLNLATYYVMKDRAGAIGRDGLNPCLRRIQSQVPARVQFHLVGHSFGARLLTATADGPETLRVNSLTLLQGAYSHNGLALNFDGRGTNGFFHKVVTERKVTGPILITHSDHDEAVGLAYPLASRLNGTNAAKIGDANDIYGGMGANGAQHLNTTNLLLTGQHNFRAPDSTVFNLNGDAIIKSHGDVARPETAALLDAVIRQYAD